MSFRNTGIGMSGGNFVGIRNFIWVFNNPDFYGTLGRTFVWVFGSVFLEMILGTSFALLLNVPFKLRPLARAVILAPYMIPTVVAVLTWTYMFNDLVGIVNYALMKIGLIDSPFQWMKSPSTAMMTVIVVGVWKFTPFVVIAMLAILQAIPQEQYDAARVDGATAWQQYWRITLPHILPVFLLTTLLRTIWAINKFDIIYLLTGGGPGYSTTTLPVLVYDKGFDDFQLGRASALALASAGVMIIIMLVYLFAMKRVEDKQ
jgi:multiple sugar transport system permease protein